MYRYCHTHKTTAQQQAFEDALLAAMRTKTLESITVVELCTAAGVSRRSFYRLFETKQDVVISLIDHTLLSYAHFEPVGYRSETQRYLLFWKENREWLDALIRNRLVDLLMDRLVRITSTEDFPLQTILGATDGKNKRGIFIFNLGGLMGLIIDWHNSGYLLSTDELALLVWQLMTHPLIKDY